MAIAVAQPKAGAVFPEMEVERSLREELLQAAETEAGRHGTHWPGDAGAQGSVSIHVDSLVVVEILCTVEPILGFALHEGLVRAGGYWSINQAMDHLMPRIEEEWKKRKGGKA